MFEDPPSSMSVAHNARARVQSVALILRAQAVTLYTD
jgi:hypothetical protein